MIADPRGIGRAGLLIVSLLLSWGVIAGDPSREQQPKVALILDDLGNHLGRGMQALDLPQPVTLAILPHTPHARKIAELGYERGNEVMLHLPMESKPWHRLGPGGLTAEMSQEELLWVVAKSLEAVPHVTGVNNHMGSRLTARSEAMVWLMRELSQRGDYFFVDSRTTADSVAWRIARENAVPSTSRDVFLDNRRAEAAIRHQFQHLIEMAKGRGYAVGIGHPYPETLRVLADSLKQLEELDVDLVPVSEIIEIQKRRQRWQAPSSPSLKVAKSSKP